MSLSSVVKSTISENDEDPARKCDVSAVMLTEAHPIGNTAATTAAMFIVCQLYVYSLSIIDRLNLLRQEKAFE